MLKKIESLQNPRIKILQRVKARKHSNLWIIEGQKLLTDALQSGVRIKEVYFTENWRRRESGELRKLEKAGADILLISDGLMRKISEMKTPAGMLAVAEKPLETVKQPPKGFAAFLYSVRDPGNFGTLIRAAEAAGADFLAYTSDCVEPYQAKVVRASAGSIFRLPLLEVANATDFLHELIASGVQVYGLYTDGGEDLFRISPEMPALLVIGSESHGLQPDLAVGKKIRIPMAGRVESLNAAMAGAICFYHFFTTLGERGSKGGRLQ